MAYNSSECVFICYTEAIMKFYLVGGFVRSLFTGEKTKDIDICVEGAEYSELLEFLLDHKVEVLVPQPQYHHLFFFNSAYQMPDDSNTTSWNMGRITAKVGKVVVDFLLARKELDVDYNQKNVIPASVVNTPDVTILEDLSRRDFTMNAMAIPIEFDFLTFLLLSFRHLEKDRFSNLLKEKSDNTIIDPYGGLDDIEVKVIDSVGCTFDRFSADPTRILRALKFALRLGYTLSDDIETILWKCQNVFCALYDQKVNSDRSCNELTALFKEAPSWKVLLTLQRYLPDSLLRAILCDDKINLYPSLRSK